MPNKTWNKFNKSKPNQQSWILAMPEEVDLLNTLKNLHRLNNYIGRENESYINFIHNMNNFYMNILSENNKQK